MSQYRSFQWRAPPPPLFESLSSSAAKLEVLGWKAGRWLRFILLAATMPLAAQLSLEITLPVAGTEVNPGQTLNVKISVTGGQPSTVFLIGNPSTFGQATSAPWQLTLTVPPDAPGPGPFSITAGGSLTPGTVVYSDPITLDIERSDKPVSIRAEEDSLVFDKPGQ